MGTRSGLISVLRGEVGTQEGFSGGHWNNIQKYSEDSLVSELSWSDGQPWCAVFATWAYRKAGIAEGSFPVTASVNTAYQWYRARGRWSEYPSVGAQVILGSSVHTGIVIDYDSDYITTVEGNTNTNGSSEGDGVYYRKRYRRDSFVTGYGSPDFDPEPSSYVPFPGSQFFFDGQNSDIITKMGERLVAEGCSTYKVGPSPDWSNADQNSYSLWQQKLGYSGADADGIPGPTSWAALKVPA